MGAWRLVGSGGFRPGAPVLAVAVLVTAALAGSGPVAAAALAGGGPAAGVIATVAGGVGGPAKATKVAITPCGVAFGAGHVYIGDGAAVRSVSPQSAGLTTPAGTGVFLGPFHDGGPAARADLYTCRVAVDHSGNLLIPDAESGRVRAVAASTGTFYGQPMIAGHIYTIAGNGTAGFSGDGGPATAAGLGAAGVVVDAAGNVVIADANNERIRVVAAGTGTFYGQPMTAGDIYTIAGNGTAGFSGDSGPATSAELNRPVAVAVDATGNLVINDNGNDRVRLVAAGTGTFYGQPMTAGDIYTIAGNGTPGSSGDGGPATAAELDFPQGVAVDAAGNLLIADFSHRVRAVAASAGTFYGRAMTAGDIYTIAGNGHHGFSGDGGPATAAELNFPQGVAVDAAGDLLIADTNNHRIRAVAASTGTLYGKSMTAGDIYTIAGNGTGEPMGQDTAGFSGDGGLAVRAQFFSPDDVAVDAAGNLVVADQRNNRVRVAAASTGTFYGQQMTTGHMYTAAGGGASGLGDGGPATKARLRSPQGVAVDAATGNLLIADTNGHRVRVVAASTGTFYGQQMTAGDIYTVAGDGTGGFSGDGGPATAAELDFPQGVAADAAGNLLIADTVNVRLRVVAASTGTFYGQQMTAGDIYTVAGGGTSGLGDGGPATSAELSRPTGATVDAAGNLLIADFFSARTRVVAASTGTFYGQAMTAGDIYTVAGGGTSGLGDGGPATKAIVRAQGVAVDAAGNLVLADGNDSRIRVVAVSTGTFYGKAMKKGDIYTIAGHGTSGTIVGSGFSGDGGPATKAELSGPQGVAVTAGGDIVIADTGNNRIREITG